MQKKKQTTKKIKRPSTKGLGSGLLKKAADKASAHRKRTEAALKYK